MIKARRTLRRRITVVGAVVILCGISVVGLLIGSTRLKKVIVQEQHLQLRQNQFVQSIGGIRRETALLENQNQKGNPSRIEAELAEMSELWRRFLDEFKTLLTSHPLFSELREEWEEIAALRLSVENYASGAIPDGGSAPNWTQLSTDLGMFKRTVDDIADDIGEQLHLRRETSQWMIFAATLAVIMAFLLALWLLITVVSDIASESYNLDNLQQEIDDCVHGNQFKNRIKLLMPPDQRESCTGEWSTEIKRILPERRTHICFELVVRNNDVEIWLWGRRYKWAGHIKSFQRVLFPAFAEATWRALSRMYNNGLSSPAPIARQRLKAGPFRAGHLILMEHAGEVESVKEFMKCHFCLMSRSEQNDFLQHLIRFIHSLHKLGIYGAKARYLHGKNLTSGEEKRQFYLFDLDKVVLWQSPPSIVDKWLRDKDHKRLMKRLEPLVNQERLETVQEWLNQNPNTEHGSET